jgi:hypothetical protein
LTEPAPGGDEATTTESVLTISNSIAEGVEDFKFFREPTGVEIVFFRDNKPESLLEEPSSA